MVKRTARHDPPIVPAAPPGVPPAHDPRPAELEDWRETFEGPTRLLAELPIIGRSHLPDAIRGALRPDSHSHEFELHVVREGSMEFWVEDPSCVYAVHGGMAILTQPGQLHAGVHEVLSPGRWYRLRWRWPGDGGAMAGMSLEQTRSLRRALGGVNPPAFPCSRALESCLERLLEEHRRRGAGAELMARSILHELIVQVIRDHGARGARSGCAAALAASIRLAAEILRRAEELPASVDDVAGRVGLSPGCFRRAFRQETGFTPADYLLHHRIERAKRLLLADGRPTVTRIAMQLNFSSSAYFAAVFRKKVGLTPTQFVAQHRAHGADGDGGEGA